MEKAATLTYPRTLSKMSIANTHFDRGKNVQQRLFNEDPHHVTQFST